MTAALLCPCTAPNPWNRFAEPCQCTDAERLARAMDLLFALAQAFSELPAMENERAFNRAYSEADDFLAANGRPVSKFSARLEETAG